MIKTELDGIIGEPLVVPDLSVHDSSCGRGVVLNKNSPYAPNTVEEAPYDGYVRATREGPIIPVNDDYSGKLDNLVVVWYQRGRVQLKDTDQGACWLSKPVKYNCEWPNTAPTITIASRKGADISEDWTNVQIYNQPDPEKPGCNPNEEHA